MATTPEERAEQRRRGYDGGVLYSDEDARLLEVAFWKRLSGEERLTATWSLTLDYLALGGAGDAPPRLDRSASGVRRR